MQLALQLNETDPVNDAEISQLYLNLSASHLDTRITSRFELAVYDVEIEAEPLT